MKTWVGELSSLFRTSTLTFPPSQLIPYLLFSGSSPSCTVTMWHWASLYFRPPVLICPPPEHDVLLPQAHALGCSVPTKQHRKRLQHGWDAFKRTKSQCWKSALRLTDVVQVAVCAGQGAASCVCCKSWGNLLLIGLFSRSKIDLK